MTLEQGDYSFTFLLVEGNRSMLIQSDWEYPGIAMDFGWTPCHCGETDRTVDCKHRTAHEMIAEAHEFLLDVADTGMEVEDPGYFKEN